MTNDKAQISNQAQMAKCQKFYHFDFGFDLAFKFCYLDLER